MGEQQRSRCTPKRNFSYVRTKQYQMKRSLKVENGEQLKSDDLASLKVLSATAKRHAFYRQGSADNCEITESA